MDPVSRASFTAGDLFPGAWLHTQWGPIFGLMSCHHLKILNPFFVFILVFFCFCFWTRGRAFLFCTVPCKSCGLSRLCPIRTDTSVDHNPEVSSPGPPVPPTSAPVCFALTVAVPGLPGFRPLTLPLLSMPGCPDSSAFTSSCVLHCALPGPQSCF